MATKKSSAPKQPRLRSHSYARRPTPDNIHAALVRLLKPYGADRVVVSHVKTKAGTSHRATLVKADGRKLLSKVGAGPSPLEASRELVQDALAWFGKKEKAVIDAWLELHALAGNGIDPAAPPQRTVLRREDVATPKPAS